MFFTKVHITNLPFFNIITINYLAKFLFCNLKEILLLFRCNIRLDFFKLDYRCSFNVRSVLFLARRFLNDLNRISFSKALFLTLAALVYLVISFLLYRTYESKFIGKYIPHPLLRGVISGFLLVLFSFLWLLF